MFKRYFYVLCEIISVLNLILYRRNHFTFYCMNNLVDVFFFSHPIDFDLLHFSRSCAVDPGPWSHARLFNVKLSSHVGNVQPADAQWQAFSSLIKKEQRTAVIAEKPHSNKTICHQTFNTPSVRILIRCKHLVFWHKSCTTSKKKDICHLLTCRV